MIYFDNAATTYKKPRNVIRAVKECIKKYSANPGRGAHRMSLLASEAVYSARERISDFFRADSPEGVVFTYNTTYALNLAIKTLIEPNSHVIISNLEHNSVLRPIHKLREGGKIEYSIFNAMATDLRAEIISHLRANTKAIICTAASNVTGRNIPLYILGDIKRTYGVKLIIDAAQAAGHKAIDVKSLSIDALCFPSHKAMLGIMGTGACIFADKRIRDTLIEGGSGTSSNSLHMPNVLPEAVEAGTLGLPGIIALSEGVRFIDKYGIGEIEGRLDGLTDMTIERLESVRGVRIVGAESGVISFLVDGVGSEYTAALLDKGGVCTRAGLHCAPLAHKALGTLDSGTVRVSLSVFNTKREIDHFYRILRRI